MENSNCCSPNQDPNSSCCPTPLPVEDNNKNGFKKKIGMLVMGLALMLTVSSAFKIATKPGDGFSPLSIEDFEWMETDKEVAYILLKGEEKEQNKFLSKQIREVVRELNSTDGSVEYFELNPALQHYNSFIERTGVEEIPSVVVLGRGANLSFLPSESVSSLKLFRAYVTATTPATSCNPADCDPSKTCAPGQNAKCCTKKSN